MSTVIHVVPCLNFLVILPPRLIHSATIKELQDVVGFSRFRETIHARGPRSRISIKSYLACEFKNLNHFVFRNF